MAASVRTCIGCRRRSSTNRLVRIRWSDEDERLTVGIGPGRGAWLHRDSDCATAAGEDLLRRALRTSVPAGQLAILLDHWPP